MYISDQGNTRIRRVDGAGIISTFAGGAEGFADGVGEAARFAWPTGTDSYPAGKMDVSADGAFLFLADTNNNRIRRIEVATRTVTTVAGTGAPGYAGDGGPALEALFNRPTDVASTPDGGLFIADSFNHVIRRIEPDGTVRTVVGKGVRGSSPDGAPVLDARLNRPSGISWDEASRTLYIADSFNHQVKKVKLGD
jgi:sugar lactone lactonase YvrE